MLFKSLLFSVVLLFVFASTSVMRGVPARVNLLIQSQIFVGRVYFP